MTIATATFRTMCDLCSVRSVYCDDFKMTKMECFLLDDSFDLWRHCSLTLLLRGPSVFQNLWMDMKTGWPRGKLKVVKQVNHFPDFVLPKVGLTSLLKNLTVLVVSLC